jgi:hypothetical protein
MVGGGQSVVIIIINYDYYTDSLFREIIIIFQTLFGNKSAFPSFGHRFFSIGRLFRYLFAGRWPFVSLLFQSFQSIRMFPTQTDNETRFLRETMIQYDTERYAVSISS